MKKNKDSLIHIVHIIPTLNFGGAEKFVVDLTKNLSTEKFRQTIITFWDSRPLISQVPAGVECKLIFFPTISRWRRIFVIASYLREINADIVHTHLFSADVWGRLAARYAGIPVVTTEHNINKSESTLWMMIKRVMKNFSVIYTAPSKAVAEYMEKSYKISPDKIKIIPHGIEIENFATIPPASFVTPYRLAVVGRLTEQKGHRVALEALRELSDIDCRLIFTGSGELKPSLAKYASELGVGERVEWREATTEVSSAYREADILIVPSLWEGLGLVVLEGMASGRLVIASQVDGIKEIIVDGNTGLFFQTGDSADLAKVIRLALGDRERAMQIAKRAKEWVSVNSKIEKMIEQYESVYLQLLETKK